MSNPNSKPTLGWWIMITVSAGCLVLLVASTVRSIANILREPVLSPLIVAAPATTPMVTPPEPATPLPVAAAAPPPPKLHNNITPDFEQSVRAEQERKQSYQILREQAKAHPGQFGTLTEKEIQKLEKEGITGDSGYP